MTFANSHGVNLAVEGFLPALRSSRRSPGLEEKPPKSALSCRGAAACQQYPPPAPIPPDGPGGSDPDKEKVSGKPI